MKLDWPEFQLHCQDDGHLVFLWRQYGIVESNVKHCTRIQLVPQGPDGLSQWLFHLRFPAGPTPGLLIARVDVPADRFREAEEYTDLLRRRYAVPEQPAKTEGVEETEHAEDAERAEDSEEAAEETGFQRVPLDSREWLVAPAGAASEELFGAVLAHVAAD
ncbi:hypothetical protein NFX46_26905 [Streptomyces phaeoluteigriseus]|uniref:Uncharacterized protein n=1 Tax=Streptomyces phaeoluteigriseus TaxID=114686 RepID=A0ABY4ZDI7_9ACTN|nr:hypothetical protein [Streptomyces phaeoluteigriseus]USQ87026.1 hypothetical protein NFX46_26905 [Streptomyces phaeoluteigriseus]